MASGGRYSMLKSVEIPFSGHPNKICDFIVESIVDEYLKRDPKSRMNIQAMGSHGMMMIGGIVDSRADFDITNFTKGIYKKRGFTDDIEPFVNIHRPSEEFSKILVNGHAQGSAIVYGYATKETRERLPRALVLATSIAKRIEDLRRHDKKFAILKPDGKVQVSMEGKMVKVISLFVQHEKGVKTSDLQSLLIDAAIKPIIGDDIGVKFFINPSGTFTEGGFGSFSGSSGNKISLDLYGGLLPYAGSVSFGKDPLHPAKCGVYMARFIAKTLVDEGLLGNAFVQIGYATGYHEPIFLDVRGGGGENYTDYIKSQFDLRPAAIVERFDLQKPIYASMANYGQFGRDLAWEQTGIDKKREE